MGTNGAEAAQAEAAARARALDLLEATHQFPCAYSVTVIAFNLEGVTERIMIAVRMDVEPSEDDKSGEEAGGYQSRASREGKYLSHRFDVRVRHAKEVLELYARLRAVDGVVTIL